MTIKRISPGTSMIESFFKHTHLDWSKRAPGRVTLVRVTVKNSLSGVWIDWFVFKNHETGVINKFSAQRKSTNAQIDRSAKETLEIAFDKLGKNNDVIITNRPNRVDKAKAIWGLSDLIAGVGVVAVAFPEEDKNA